MQLLASLALTLSTLAFNAYASPDAGNNLEIRNAYLRPHQVPRENTLGGLLGIVRRQGCTTGFAACVVPAGFCCPITSSCCTGVGAGGCCPDTEYCSVVDGIPGCCPNGQTCTLPPDSSVVPSVPSTVGVPTFISSSVGIPASTSVPKVSLTNTGLGSSTAIGGGATGPTGTVSLLPPSVNPTVLSNNAGSTGTGLGAASPSGQTGGGSGSNNPFTSSGASPSSTTTSLGFLTLCGSALVSVLVAALL